MARELNVKPEEVLEMEDAHVRRRWLLDPSPDDDGERPSAPIAYLADDRTNPPR